MMKHLPHNIYFKDAESRFLLLSQTLAESFGLDDPNQAVGKTDRDFFDEAHAEKARADELKLLSGEESIIETHEREIWPNGEATWASTTKLPLTNEEGHIIGTFGISRDISSEMIAEQALKEAAEAAGEANRSKSEFLANMSHEIRTPMNGIIGMSELLLRTNLTNSQREYSQLIHQSADHLLNLLSDILDFSKIEAGKLDLDPHEFKLRDSIGDTLQTLELAAEEKGLELAYHIPPAMPDHLVGDLSRLRQIIVNLVGNAIKFTSDGEVVVDFATETQTASEIVLHIAVRDTGIGIEPTIKEEIFKSFTQADASTTRRFGGTGLGLAISKQLSHLMGGRIWLESEYGKGSTFHFTVQFEIALGDEDTEQAANRIETLHDLKVLVVDDNETNRRILEEILESWKMTPFLASSGTEALEILRDEPGIPLAILDLMMPEMDGLELARRIGEMLPSNPPALMLLSSATSPPTRERRQELGISHCLYKPAKQSDLFDAITKILNVASRDPDPGTVVEPPRVEKARNSLRILLVEDGEINQEVATHMLTLRGHTVQLAKNGKEAVDAYAATPTAFDAVLMDLQMPILNGFAANSNSARTQYPGPNYRDDGKCDERRPGKMSRRRNGRLHRQTGPLDRPLRSLGAAMFPPPKRLESQIRHPPLKLRRMSLSQRHHLSWRDLHLTKKLRCKSSAARHSFVAWWITFLL